MRIGRAILIGLIVGAIVGLAFCAMALDHNPQGEFADLETGRYTAELYWLIGIMSAMVAVPTIAFLTVIEFLRARAD